MASGSRPSRTENYTLVGTLRGSVCKFSITVTEPSQNVLGSIGILGERGSRSGFIAFAADGKSGTYAELANDKLGSGIRIFKVER